MINSSHWKLMLSILQANSNRILLGYFRPLAIQVILVMQMARASFSITSSPIIGNTLLGDFTRAREKLGWYPRNSFEELISEMVMEPDKTGDIRATMLKQCGWCYNRNTRWPCDCNGRGTLGEIVRRDRRRGTRYGNHWQGDGVDETSVSFITCHIAHKAKQQITHHASCQKLLSESILATSGQLKLRYFRVILAC